MKLRAYYEINNEVNGTHVSLRRLFGLGNAIKIWNPQKTSVEVYSTTIHEIAHASHWSMDKSNYIKMNDCSDSILGINCSGSPKVAESWARGVEWELTRIIYPDYLGRVRTTNDYTLVVADMIDGSATDDNKTNKGFVDSHGVDNVEGYTIRQIEDALIGQKTWNGWRDSIKNKYNNGTRNNLDALFAAYQ